MSKWVRQLAPVFLLMSDMSASQAQAEDGSNDRLAITSTVTTRYISRGLSQSANVPAAQLALDWRDAASGWSAGLWSSTVSNKVVRKGRMEFDAYASYRTTFGPLRAVTGIIAYLYPEARLQAEQGASHYDYAEVFSGVGYGFFDLQANHVVTRSYFGIDAARGTQYLKASFRYPFTDDFAFESHIGKTSFAGRANHRYDFKDYRLALTGTLTDSWTTSLAYTRAIDSNGAYRHYFSSSNRAGGIDRAKGTVTISASRQF